MQPILYDGRPSLFLRDPLQLTDTTIVVPYVLGPMLALLDGSHDIEAARAALVVQYGMDFGREPLDKLVSALDEAMLLDNDRSKVATAAALQAYRSAACRPPSLAGTGYPDSASELAALLDGHLAEADADEVGSAGDGDNAVAGSCMGAAAGGGARGPIRGLISPHIDYHRGGLTYAKVWRRAAEAARDADLVVMLGTDHNGRSGSITLTRQNYSTPYGTMPTDTDVVEALALALGEGACFDAELNHRAEHSVELSTVWLHHMRGAEPVPIVPVLCGSFGQFVEDTTGPEGDETVERFVDALRPILSGRRAIVVASADLSHVGPAFGGDPVSGSGGAMLRMADGRLLSPVLAGNAPGFFEVVRATGDRTNVCGIPPIYLMLRLLDGADGELVAYDTCPADDQGSSLVSVCGALLR